MTKTVKVYKVTAMAEVEVEGNNRPAIEAALDWAKTDKVIWTQPDCEIVAVLMVNHVEADNEDTGS